MTAFRRAVGVAFFLLLCEVPALEAQDTLSLPARLLLRQPPGAIVRVDVGGELVTGVIARVTADTLYLTEPERVVPLVAISDAWVQQRATRTGGKAGALIGVPVGAAVFGFGAFVYNSLCESGCEDWGAGGIAIATLIGAAAGGVAGYLLGALFGASIPEWEPITEARTVAIADPVRRTGLSAASITATLVQPAVDANGVGSGVSASYLTQLSRHFALGAEVGTYDVTSAADPEIDRTWSAGGLARAGTGADLRVEPYALFGIGVTNFRALDVTLGSYSAGAGVRFRPSRGFAFSVEGRWHSNFTNSGYDRALGFYTAGVSLTLLP